MAKRFTDTDLWQKPWFMGLSAHEKVAWFYIKDHCDCVGVWTPNLPLAEFIIGGQVDWALFRDKCNGNIEVMKNGKWLLQDFCFFQYGELTTTCKPHLKYMQEAERHGILERVSKGYPKGIHTRKEKEEEKEQEKEQEKDAPKKYSDAFESFWKSYPKKQAKGAAWKVWKKDKLDIRLDEILQSLETYKRIPQWTKDGGQFIPNPATWLNGSCYDDEPVTAPRAYTYTKNLGTQ